MTVMTSREFSDDTAKAKREALLGPVFITDDGKPAHVLLSIDAYNTLGKPTSARPQDQNIVDALALQDLVDDEIQGFQIENLKLKVPDFS